MADESMNIYQKLALIRGIADVVKKDKSGYNYKYTDVNEILAKVTAGMKKYNVSLIPSIVPGTTVVSQNVVTNTKFDKTGKPYEQVVTEMIVTSDMVFTWVNDENPEDKICVPWFITGSQADPSQAFGSGLTYCTRYFLCNYFQIAQDNDVDSYRSKQKEAEAREEKALVAAIIENIDNAARRVIALDKDKAESIKKFMEKYASKGNYFAIKDAKLAAKLLEDFNKEFGTEEQ